MRGLRQELRKKIGDAFSSVSGLLGGCEKGRTAIADSPPFSATRGFKIRFAGLKLKLANY